MTEKKVYVCGYCGEQYDDVGQCQRCEKFHVAVSRIVKPRYYPIGNSEESVLAGKYPYELTIRMEDGTEVKYAADRRMRV